MATNIVLNETTVMNYLQSNADFPVDFDYAWKWLGYSTKANALRTLKDNFVYEVEFSSSMMKSPSGGRPKVSHALTNACFKELAMMSGTEKGKEVRRYYIECEKALKQKQYQPPSRPALTAEQSIGILSEAFKIFKLENSPRHLQLAQDRIANLLGGDPAMPVLAPAKWYGVAEIAEQLGFDSYQVSKLRSGLGRVVAAWYRDAESAEPMTEDRLVNGRTCSLKVYQRTNELDTIISSYLSAKGLESNAA